MRAEQPAQGVSSASLRRKAPVLRKQLHERPHPRGVAAGKLEQKALEIAGKLDVHAGARGRDHAHGLVNSRTQNAKQTVVEVRGNNEARDRQAHPRAA